MNLTWLEDFLALARAENFSRAAEMRNVTQPAFSRRIRAIEEWSGVVLVDRDTHRIKLTPAGNRLVEIADSTLRTLENGRRELLEIASASQSHIRIAATHSLSMNFFPNWVSSIQAQAEQTISVQLTADKASAAEQAMLHGKAQFLLCHYHPMAAAPLDQRNFISVTLGSDRLIPVCASDTADNHGFPGHPDAPVAYLQYGSGSGMGRIIKAARAKAEPVAHLTPVFRSHAAMVLAEMARQGKGMAWLPESLIRQDIVNGALVRAGSEAWDIPMEIRIYRPRARQSAAAEDFWTRALATGERE